jgi:hypothetical protein
VAYEKSRNIRRNMASVAELKKSFFAEFDKVENREDLEKLRVKYLGREKGILTAVFAFAWRYSSAPELARLTYFMI